jgi:hypothetical protein
MNKLQHFTKYKLSYELALLFCYFFINHTLLATSVIMEQQRADSPMPFQLWEPFIWEYSSGLSALMLFPLLSLLSTKQPFTWQTLKHSLLIYFIASIIFCLCHLLLMISIREIAYLLMSRHYDFGNIWYEFIYEYRKDLWSFIFFIIFIKGYNFIVSRLEGEASPIAQSEEENDREDEPQLIDRLLVKKLGKEFIIKIDDVEWLESAGNYVNLHSKGRIYPLRATLTKLVSQISTKDFCRIHRSHAINLNSVESITPLPSGDSEVRLSNGKVLSLSRRYKDNFKSGINAY